MHPKNIQQQRMQQALMGKGQPRPMAAEGGIMRLGLKEGGGMNRRGFMKLLAGIAALPVIGKYFKAAKLAKPAAKVAETIVKSNAPGMPAWFPSLVRKVIKEGEDVSKGAATLERQTVHKIKLPESGTPVEVARDLVTDDIVVDIGMGKHGWSSGFNGQPTRLVLKKGEWIEPTKGKKGIKTKDEFSVEEAEFTGGHPENIKYEDVSIEKYGEHGSDFSEVEKFATGKVSKKSKPGKSDWQPDWDDSLPDDDGFGMASGGLAQLMRPGYAAGAEVYGPSLPRKEEEDEEEEEEEEKMLGPEKFADPYWRWDLKLPTKEKPGERVDPVEGIGLDDLGNIDVDMSDPRFKLGLYNPKEEYFPWEFEVGKESAGIKFKKRFNQGGLAYMLGE